MKEWPLVRHGLVPGTAMVAHLEATPDASMVVPRSCVPTTEASVVRLHSDQDRPLHQAVLSQGGETSAVRGTSLGQFGAGQAKEM